MLHRYSIQKYSGSYTGITDMDQNCIAYLQHHSKIRPLSHRKCMPFLFVLLLHSFLPTYRFYFINNRISFNFQMFLFHKTAHFYPLKSSFFIDLQGSQDILRAIVSRTWLASIIANIIG